MSFIPSRTWQVWPSGDSISPGLAFQVTAPHPKLLNIFGQNPLRTWPLNFSLLEQSIGAQSKPQGLIAQPRSWSRSLRTPQEVKPHRKAQCNVKVSELALSELKREIKREKPGWKLKYPCWTFDFITYSVTWGMILSLDFSSVRSD